MEKQSLNCACFQTGLNTYLMEEKREQKETDQNLGFLCVVCNEILS